MAGAGRSEVVTVEIDLLEGAGLAIWEVMEDAGVVSLRRLAAATHLGNKNRWLASIRAAEFDRDGAIEIAYAEKLKLDHVLRLVRLQGDRFVEVASMAR